MSGRGTRATEQLEAAGIAFAVREYERPGAHGGRGDRPSYGLEAAAALGVDPRRVFKTLIADVDGRLVAAVVPVAGELDTRALAAWIGGRTARLADPAEAERATGYVVGGISPLGQRRRLPVVVDETALEHETVLVSAGRRGLQVELAPSELVRAAGASVAAISRA